MKNKGMILLIIMIILIILTFVSTCYFYSKYKACNKEVATLNATIKEMEENNKIVDEEENADEEIFKNALVDSKIILNEYGNAYPYDVYYFGSTEDYIYLKIDEENNVYVTIYGTYLVQNSEITGVEHKIEGISGKVVEARVVPIGNGGLPVILMLMEDGTVEYVKSDSYLTSSPTSGGKVEGVENAVRIIPVSVGINMKSGFLSFLVVKSDGTTQLIQSI